MTKLVFDLETYRQWRKDNEGLTDKVLDFIIANHHMVSQDGMDRDELIRRGYIILQQWCKEKPND